MNDAKRLEPGKVHKCKGASQTNSPNPEKPFDRRAYQ
jgi:hypothetical protein